MEILKCNHESILNRVYLTNRIINELNKEQKHFKTENPAKILAGTLAILNDKRYIKPFHFEKKREESDASLNLYQPNQFSE